MEELFEFAKKFGDLQGVYKIAIYPGKNEVHVWVHGYDNAEAIVDVFGATKIKILRGDNYLVKYKIVR